jgi:hypothetical protein
VVVRHVSDAHVEVRFHHWDGELDETEDDMVVLETDTWPASRREHLLQREEGAMYARRRRRVAAAAARGV